MDKKEIKKATSIAINNARASVAASGRDTRINITNREWEAVQAGAISDSKLMSILRYADDKRVRELATPRGGQISAYLLLSLVSFFTFVYWSI